MGMAANMAAIVPAALLEHGTSGEAGLLYGFMFITGPLQPATFVTCLGYWERELNGLTRRRPGGGPRGPGSGPPSSGLLCFMFIRPGTLYTCLRRQGNEAESDVAAPGGFRSRVNEPAFYTGTR